MTERYIALEGIEGAGKSTVARRLVDALEEKGERVVAVREPGGTAAGEAIRSILLAPEGSVGRWTEALLFAAARAQLAAEVVAPALRSGAWVVSDRSVYSSLAYQGAGRRLGIEAVRAVNAPGLGEIWPGRVFLLRLDPVEGMRRQEVEDRIGSEGAEFLERVAGGFDELAAAEPGRFRVVDASASLTAVTAAVVELVLG